MTIHLAEKGLEGLWENIQQAVEGEAAEGFLEMLLKAMRMAFIILPDYRESIRKFDGSYQFTSADGVMSMAAVFSNGRMRVTETKITHPDITITFRDGKTLFKFLLAPKQDILGSMLAQDVKTDGNLNYLYRFGYLAKKLQLMLQPV
ncbi:hypothetical protein [Desulfosediminicola flagellatus]|uniref:hypothetical protein n=1 Tax=Desulfosediminicola flagellatus TaxID=2569541 RepID=UPI0010ABE878|nr:hypothetical protein [Desulfosediminicola flagellatus]